ncbi:NfeD family protein [Tepidimonas charontis]|uniref:NfeD-like C-terminal domain-containing protein n=1 Tax=Tepidimonas charontis TaxID=2267262 RepID=A0A554X2L5_9BURK|nr:NfeD family protein [Tepidimonas charontis]TSE30064.1 hypothetical protein Tchar_02506 [Tepidimonas charontis]
MDATEWWLLAGAAVVVELLTGTFFLLMLALGFSAGAVAAMLGVAQTAQLVTAAVVGGGAVAVWGIWRRRRARHAQPESNPDLLLDVGALVHVEHWQDDGCAVVRHRGAHWLAQIEGSSAPVAGTPSRQADDQRLRAVQTWRIVAVRGNRLVIAPASPAAPSPAGVDAAGQPPHG